MLRVKCSHRQHELTFGVDVDSHCIIQLTLHVLTVGLEELEEVNRNISERIHPAENHIVFINPSYVNCRFGGAGRGEQEHQ